VNKQYSLYQAIDRQNEYRHLAQGIVVGLLAAGIGALYTVYARWGINRGLETFDLTALRFGIAGLVTLPVLAVAWRKDKQQFIARWRLWALIALLAGVPFGMLMFGALQFAPVSHAAVFPFSAMSIMGMVLGAIFVEDRITSRRATGIATVLIGLILVAGLEVSSFTGRTLVGDAMFILAGTLWAGFGIILRKYHLDPLLATAVIAFSALITYVPIYLYSTGARGLVEATSEVFWTEAIVQGLIAGAGTLFTYARMVSLLGPGRAAIFPALAPGLAALLAWPVLGHVPTSLETIGCLVVMAGLTWAVTGNTQR
jgi:drug/metabolite transporter (DMT)-like permease